MRKSRVYLDTSIISFLFAEDAPEKREATVTFFEDFVRPGVYDVYVSPVVIDGDLKNTGSHKAQGFAGRGR